MSLSVRLAALLALAVLALPARAQESLAHAGIHILTVGPDGDLDCDVATEAQVQGLRDANARTAARSVRLTALPSLNRAGVSDFKIVLRATDQLLDRPEALLAFRRSAARWERIIQSDVTTVIDVDYGPERFGEPYPNNVLGSTSSALDFAGETTGAGRHGGPAQEQHRRPPAARALRRHPRADAVDERARGRSSAGSAGSSRSRCSATRRR